jgi:hypothetical protein
MAVMMNWLLSWRHYSTADNEVCSSRGLLSSYRAATSMASAATAGGGVAAVLAVRWHHGAAAPTAAAVRLSAHRDLPTLEWEVASPSVSRLWCDG